MDSGPSGSISRLGIDNIVCIFAKGSTTSVAKWPALPYEHPRPGGSRSISVTLCPRYCSCSATATPTIPAPMTTSSRIPFCLFSTDTLCTCGDGTAMSRLPMLSRCKTGDPLSNQCATGGIPSNGADCPQTRWRANTKGPVHCPFGPALGLCQPSFDSKKDQAGLSPSRKPLVHREYSCKNSRCLKRGFTWKVLS